MCVALVIQHAQRMLRIICHLPPVWLYDIFPHYLINGTIVGMSYWTQNVFYLQNLSHIFPILRWILRDIIINVKTSSCNVAVIPVRFFNQIWIFFTDFRKKLKYQISSKSVQWEPSCSRGRTDGQTDLTKLIVAFLNFAIARRDEKGKSYCVISSSLVGSSCHIQFALGAHALLHNCTLNVHNRLKPLWWIFNYHDSFIFYGSITTFEKPG